MLSRNIKTFKFSHKGMEEAVKYNPNQEMMKHTIEVSTPFIIIPTSLKVILPILMVLF